MIFYFSGTGNSRWVARQIAFAQQERLFSMTEEEARHPASVYRLNEGEAIGFVFPVHAWAPPRVVLDFITRLEFENYNGHYLFFVCTCGDDAGLTRNVFCQAVRQKGWTCQAGFSVIMPNSYVAMKGFDVDPAPLRDRKLAEAVGIVETVNRDVSARIDVFRCKKGIFPFLKTRCISPLFNRYRISAKPFRTTSRCTGCGKCAKACPVSNIAMGKGPVWGDRCTGCLACYHTCPVHAIAYGDTTANKGQYRHPEE